MALSVGSIEATLGARFDPSAFIAFDSAMKKSAASAATFEKEGRRSSTAMDGFAVASSRGSRAASAMGTAMKAGAVVGIAAVGYGLVSAGKSAASFEAKMSTLQAVSHASGAQMKMMSRQALDLGAKTGVGAGAAADAMIELARGGMSAKTTIQALPGTIALAQAGNIGLAESATTVVKALATFGLKGRDASMVADGLASAANKTSMDVADFAQAFAQGGAAANAAGMSFDQTLDVMGAMANQFQSGSDMGTSLKTTLSQLAKPTAQAKAEMKRLGVEVFDHNGKIKSAATLSRDLGKAFDGLTNKEKLKAAATIAGTDGMRTLLALSKSSAAHMREEGAATDTAAKQQRGAAGAMRKLGASWESAKIQIGSSMMPGVAQGAEELAAKLREMSADGSLDRFGASVGRMISAFASALPWVINAFTAIDNAGRKTKDVMLGVFTGMLRTISTVLKGLDQIPDPFHMLPDFGKAARGVDAYADKIDRTRESLRYPINASIRMVVNGDRPAAEKVRKLQRMDVPPKVALILMRGDLNAQQKIDRIKLLTLQPKIQRILENGSLSVQQKVRALRALGLPAKLQRLLANNQNAMAGIAAVRSAIASLPKSTTTTITTRRINEIIQKKQFFKIGKKARGRGPSGSEDALTGEGGGPEWIANARTGAAYRVNAPTMVSLAPDDYVIPTEQKYRGRALGLMAALASDLGVSGYAKGKKGKKPLGKNVPAKLDPLRLPVDDIQKARDDAKSKLDKDVEQVRSLPGDIRQAQSSARDTKLVGRGKNKRRVPTEPAKDARKKLPGLRRKLAAAKAAEKRDRAAWKQRAQEYAQAQAYQEKINDASDTAELGRIDMDTGNKTGNLGLYNSGKEKRRKAIERMRALLLEARKHVKDPAYGRQIDHDVAQAGLDIATDAGDKFSPDAADAPDMLTDAEQAAVDAGDAATALAALTDTTSDDISAAQGMVALREAILARVKTTNQPAWIAQAAQDVKSARDSLASLTDTSNTPAAADMKTAAEDQLQSLYSTYGSNFERAAGARFFGSGPLGAAGGGVTIHQSFPTQPDAMTWAAMTKFQIEAIG